MKLAFIVQRYGRDILGGSETLARQLAERLSRRYEITVLTTTAKDYITWKNELPPGEDKERGVRVIRFPVERERNLEEFNKFSEEIYKGTPTREQELEWLSRQGPVVPELVEYLKREHEQFDLLIFFTYLYYPTFYGLQVAPEKSVLLPTAHDEPPLKLSIFREMFQLPSSFLFNTEAEEVLVLERFPVHKKMRETIGIGMELLDQPDIHVFRKKHDVPGKYLLYAGRIDAGKGLEELFRFFEFYKEENPGSGNLQLILIGRLSMKLPVNASIRYIGFVDEGDKLAAMAGAVAVVQPSRLESLSIVTLEAFSVSTPLLASAGSRVLSDHCRRSNAGLYYGDFEEFEEILTLLLTDRNLARDLGRNGQDYVKNNFGWNKLLAKYELVFRASARPSKEPRSTRSRPGPPASREARDQVEAVDSDVLTEDLPLLEPGEIEGEVEEFSDQDPSGAATDDAMDVMEEEGVTEPSYDEPPPEVERRDEEARDADVVEEEYVEPVQPEEPEEHEEEVNEETESLPSFYRSSVPPVPVPPPPPVAPPEMDGPPTEPKPALPPDPIDGPSEKPPGPEAPKAAPEEPEEDESGLPSFYRPRPRPADKPKEG